MCVFGDNEPRVIAGSDRLGAAASCGNDIRCDVSAKFRLDCARLTIQSAVVLVDDRDNSACAELADAALETSSSRRIQS